MRRFGVLFSFLMVAALMTGCASKGIQVGQAPAPESDATTDYIGPAEGSAKIVSIGPLVFGAGNSGSIGNLGAQVSLWDVGKRAGAAAAKFKALKSVPNADAVRLNRVETDVKGFPPFFAQVTAEMEGAAYEVNP